MNQLRKVACGLLVLLAVPSFGEESSRVSAEFGKGLTLKSPTDDFEFNVRARAQLRLDAVFPNDESTTLRTNDFMVRRARISLKAQYKKHFRMDVQLAVSRQDMEADAPNVLRDAYVTYTRFRDLNIRMGQMKVPFGRQRVVSSSALQMVDRAAVVSELNLDRDVGIVLRSDDFLGLDGRLSYQLGVFGGDGRNRVGSSNGGLYVARLQWGPFGKIENELQEGDFAHTPAPRLLLGVAVARNQDTHRVRSTFGDTVSGGIDYNHVGADLLFRYRGFSLTSEFLLRRAVHDRNSTPKNRSGMGYYVQAGYLVTPHVEVCGRFGNFFPDARSVAGLRQQTELGAGLNWYLEEHNLKLQTDYVVLAGPQFKAMDSTFRAQTQFYF